MKSECYNFLKHKLVPRDVLRYSVSTEFDMSYKLIIIISDLLTLPKENFFFFFYPISMCILSFFAYERLFYF